MKRSSIKQVLFFAVVMNLFLSACSRPVYSSSGRKLPTQVLAAALEFPRLSRSSVGDALVSVASSSSPSPISSPIANEDPAALLSLGDLQRQIDLLRQEQSTSDLVKLGFVSVRSFGAVGDGLNDDTDAVLRTIASAPDGSSVVFPPGRYRVTAPVLVSKNINLNIQGVLVADFAGTALELRNLGQGTSLKCHHVINVVRANVEHASEANVGVLIQSCYSQTIEVRNCAGFGRGVVMSSASGAGTVYCNLTLGELANNKVGLDLAAPVGGWVNQNTFIGGRFYYSQGAPAGFASGRPGYVHVRIRGSAGDNPWYRSNGNLFVNPSLEDIGDGGRYADALQVDGMHNAFYGVRGEGSRAVKLGATAMYNLLTLGPYIGLGEVSDLGRFNKVVTSGGGLDYEFQAGGAFFTSNLSGQGAINGVSNTASAPGGRFQNRQGGPAVEIMDANGTVVAASISGNNVWQMGRVGGKARRTVFGNFLRQPNSGTWELGDVSYSSDPTQSGYLGWVCILAGSPGTWVPFAPVELSPRRASLAVGPFTLQPYEEVVLTLSAAAFRQGDVVQVLPPMAVSSMVSLRAYVESTGQVRLKVGNPTPNPASIATGDWVFHCLRE